MLPVVRLMVPCEEVKARDTGQVDILGVIGAVDVALSAFPIELDFCVYVSLANGRGKGVGKLVIVHEDTDQAIQDSEEIDFDFGNNPMVLVAAMFYIPACTLTSPGIYRLDLVYNGTAIGNCMIPVREA